MTYISHARTLLELKEEICSDIRRRLNFLDNQIKFTARSAREQSRLDCAKHELENMLMFWSEINLPHANEKAKR